MRNSIDNVVKGSKIVIAVESHANFKKAYKRIQLCVNASLRSTHLILHALFCSIQ